MGQSEIKVVSTCPYCNDVITEEDLCDRCSDKYEIDMLIHTLITTINLLKDKANSDSNNELIASRYNLLDKIDRDIQGLIK